MKIKESVMIYQINHQFFIRDREQIFELEYNKDPKLLLKYIEALDRGISPSFKEKLSKEAQKELNELCAFLEQNNLLETQETGQEKNPKSPAIRDLSIYIETGNEKFKETLSTVLQENNVATQKDANRSNFLILIADTDTPEGHIEAINEKNHRAQKVCLFIDLSIGHYGALGPLIVPGVTACYQCFITRKNLNGDVLTEHQSLPKEYLKQGRIEWAPWQYTFLASMVAHEVLSYQRGLTPERMGNILYADLKTLETWSEGLLRYPRCEICRI